MPPLLVLVKGMMRYFLLSFFVDFPPVQTNFIVLSAANARSEQMAQKWKEKDVFSHARRPRLRSSDLSFCDGVLRRKEKKKYRVRPNSVPDGLPQNNV